MTKANMAPHWEAIVDYSGNEVAIPLPGVLLPGDSRVDERVEGTEAAERLAKALLDFCGEVRANWKF